MDRASEQALLLSLRLPGNVEQEINSFRDTLFRETGAVSTQALPPLVPVAALSSHVDRTVVDSLPQTELAPLALGELQVAPGTTLLRVRFPERWQQWIETLPTSARHQSVSGILPSGLPPALTGVFLGASDLSESLQHLPGLKLPDHLPQRLRVVHVELVSLSFSEGEEWWTDVDWRVVWSHRVKLRGP